MYKTALAALALALSFGLNYSAAFAQGTSDKPQDQSGQGQTSDQKSTDQKPADQKTDQKTDTTAAAKPAAAPAAPATPANYVQNYAWSKSGAPVRTQQTAAIPPTGTAAQPTAAAAKGSAAPPTASSAKSKKDEIVVLQESPDKLYTSKVNGKWQVFETYISLKDGQDALPLTMTVTNNGYKGIAMFLSGSKLASDKDFKGNTLTMQMTGALAAGENKLTIQLLGPPAATLTWKLTTKKPVITAVTPNQGVIESEVKISGRNFAKQASANKVLVGKIPTTPRLSGKDLLINIPKEAPGGKTKIVVEIGGIASKPVEFLVKFAPEVTFVDLISAPPGQTVTISGKGFSPVRGENQVTIGGAAATVVSESATSLTVTVPEIMYPQWHVPVVVKSGGVESKKNGELNVQQRVIPNEGVPEL